MYLKVESTDRKITLPHGGKFLIGSSGDCDLTPDSPDPTVKEYHAYLQVKNTDGEYEVNIHSMDREENVQKYVGDSDGVWAWEKVSASAPLANGDRFRIGQDHVYMFVNEDNGAREIKPVRFPLEVQQDSKDTKIEVYSRRPRAMSHQESMEEIFVDTSSPDDPHGSNYMKVPSDEYAVAQKIVQFENIRNIIAELSWLHGTQMLLLYKYTVLEYVSTEPLYFITIGIYILTRVLVYYKVCDSDVKFLEPAGVISTVLSFLFVFFVSNAYSMYRSSYDASMTVHGAVQNFAVCARGGLKRPAALKTLRLLNAAHFAAYVGLTKEYTADNFFIPSVKQYSLLTDEELRFILTLNIDSTGGHGFKVIVAWIADILHLEAKNNRLDRTEFKICVDLLQKFRGQCAQLFDNRDFAVPFIYVHFVYFCTALYLPLSAYALGRAGLRRTNPASLQYETFAFIALLFKCVFFLGLYRLSRSFQNSYGFNSSCFSVKSICEETYHHSFRILNVVRPSYIGASSEVEYALHAKRPVLGTGRYVNDMTRLESQRMTDIGAMPSAKSDALPRPIDA